MKKITLFVAAISFVAFTMTSCKKDYECDYGGGDVVSYSKLGAASATTAKTACQAGGGTWNKK